MDIFPPQIEIYKWIILAFIISPHNEEYMRHVSFFEKNWEGFDTKKMFIRLHFVKKIRPMIHHR